MTDWSRAWKAARMAKDEPDELLAFLPQLRGEERHVRQHALDQIGKELAFASRDRPTMQQCRDAIGEADQESRARSVDSSTLAGRDIEKQFVTFALEALGCANEAVTGEPNPGVQLPALSEFGGSSAEWHGSAKGRLETTGCTIDSTESVEAFPGDVNSPSWVHTRCEVIARRRDGSVTMTLTANHGNRERYIHVEGELAERDRIHAMFWRTFGLPRPW